MPAVAPLVKDAYVGPVLVYSAKKAPGASRQRRSSYRRYAEDGNFFEGMLVALIMEAAGGVCLYFIWHIGHLVR
jgi:hypothetical protein